MWAKKASQTSPSTNWLLCASVLVFLPDGFLVENSWFPLLDQGVWEGISSSLWEVCSSAYSFLLSLGWVISAGDENLRGLKPPLKSVLIHAALNTESMLKPVWPSSQQVAWKSMLCLNRVHSTQWGLNHEAISPSRASSHLFLSFSTIQVVYKANDHLWSCWRGWQRMHFSNQVSLKFSEKRARGGGYAWPLPAEIYHALSRINSKLAKARTATFSMLHLVLENCLKWINLVLSSPHGINKLKPQRATGNAP